ncbi:cell wall / vacuolar inhibitor of fructosidase 1-like [Neltuma alba]|uniref:cell wall / vacuolar inhibitor of fructosidase 1-like n=1 Tax=Neltuma alba TaxID=207710 RepID=UPI0010A41A0E|nr:cell wall / vacuolar inhibitor of fructosidase 1-like [Prosopis alba]
MKSRTLIIIFTIVTISIISPSRCNNLIENTCKQTPRYNLCVQSLKSDPASSDADVRGLALIMVKVMTTKAKGTGYKIKQLLKSGHLEPKQEKALRYCADSYKNVIELYVPGIERALETGNPKFAEEGVVSTGMEAKDCEEEFSGSTSPLTKENNAMRDLAAVAVAIFRLLL